MKDNLIILINNIKLLIDILTKNNIKVAKIPYELDKLSEKELKNLENQLIIIINHAGLINYKNTNINI